MTKPASVIFWILIGALASGVGIGFFLIQANADRETLATKAAQAEQDMIQAKQQSEQIAKDANTKLSNAALEVAKAQDQLKRFEEERTLLGNATILNPISPAILRTWTSAISVSMGVSVQFPSAFTANTTDHEITLATKDAIAPTQWLSIQTYDAQKEQSWTSGLQNPEKVVYASGGHLFVGQKGSLANVTSPLYVFHTFSAAASSSLLIWARPEQFVTERRLFEIVGTINVRP
ncbi:MAG TPA: hypothetical protein VFQ60_02635 [Patescibacteria group bacterium]|nr:hypothetical protein [Patescibacteria group bacterium]